MQKGQPKIDVEKVLQIKSSLEELMRSPGYKYLEAFIDGQIMVAENELKTTTKASKMFRAAGRLQGLQLTKNWMRMQIQAFEQQIIQAREKTR